VDSAKVYEPELDMNRPAVARTSDGWRRLLAPLRWLAAARGIVGRPKRSVDREHQEFPFARD